MFAYKHFEYIHADKHDAGMDTHACKYYKLDEGVFIPRNATYASVHMARQARYPFTGVA